jgi:hypothetical protein
MDRNVVTKEDARQARKLAFARRARALQEDARAERGAALAGEPGPMAGGLDIDVKPDAWFERLAKYVPSEALGLYLALAGLVTQTDVEKHGMELMIVLLIVCLAFNTLFLRRLWKVRRWNQILVSDVALLTYTFATGGLLIQHLWFYEPRVGTALLVTTTTFLCFFKPPANQTKPDM